MYQNMLQYRKYCTELDFNKVSKFDKKLLTLIECKFPTSQTHNSNIPAYE